MDAVSAAKLSQDIFVEEVLRIMKIIAFFINLKKSHYLKLDKLDTKQR